MADTADPGRRRAARAPRRPPGISWRAPMTTHGRWFLASELLVAAMWLLVFSDPVVSLLWSVAAALLTLPLLVISLIVAATGRRHMPYRLSLRRPGRLIPIAMSMAVAVVVLCATRTPMWLRFEQARPALLELAQEARNGGGGRRALAGTYYLHTFSIDRDGVVFFETTVSGLLQESGYAYYPEGDPNLAGRPPGTTARDDGRTYTHLTGPWWIAVNDDPAF